MARPSKWSAGGPLLQHKSQAWYVDANRTVDVRLVGGPLFASANSPLRRESKVFVEDDARFALRFAGDVSLLLPGEVGALTANKPLGGSFAVDAARVRRGERGDGGDHHGDVRAAHRASRRRHPSPEGARRDQGSGVGSGRGEAPA
eukprot:1109463-Pyramimonas_sp.AAC.1